MQDLKNALRAGHRQLADAKAYAATTRANFDRARATDAEADAALIRWNDEQSAREQRHQSRVVAAISAGEAVPSYSHDVSLVAEREGIEATKRVSAQAVKQLQVAHDRATAGVKASEKAVAIAAKAILDDEAIEVFNRAKRLRAEADELADRVRAYEFAIGLLPPRYTGNSMNVPVSHLNAARLGLIERDEAPPPIDHKAEWRQRQNQLLSGADFEDSPDSTAAA